MTANGPGSAGEATVVVVEYDPAWREQFEELKSRIWPAVRDLALSVEHVGSTSVPGLAAKPVIDMDVIIPSAESLGVVVERLARIGYVHRGNLGIEGREAFRVPEGTRAHHLYVCVEGCLALKNHLLLRDYLRAQPAARDAYGELKMELARKFPCSIDHYVDGKTGFIAAVLEKQGLEKEQLSAIESANRLPFDNL